MNVTSKLCIKSIRGLFKPIQMHKTNQRTIYNYEKLKIHKINEAKTN